MNSDDQSTRKTFIDRHDKYRRKSKLEGHHGIRTGYHEDGFTSLGTAIPRMRSEMADRVDISAGDYVVDIGCGFGDCLIWLADEYNVTGLGIDIAPPQIGTAQDLAEEHDVANNTEFVAGDFHNLSSTITEPVDLAWACESLMYTSEDESVISELSKHIIPGGNIIIADTFIGQSELTPKQERLLETVYAGEECHFSSVDSIRSALTENGFENISFEEITEHIRPEIDRRAKISRFVYSPVLRAAQYFGLGGGKKTKSIEGAIASGKLVEQGAIGFYIVTASSI